MARSSAFRTWVIGSAVTLAIVWCRDLRESNTARAAVAVAVVSPFPCPPGLPA